MCCELLDQDTAAASQLCTSTTACSTSSHTSHFSLVLAHSSCGFSIHWHCFHRTKSENQKHALRFEALSHCLFNWSDFAKIFCLSLKWEKSHRGKKTFKFCYYCRIYMLWILNFGFSTCFHCSEVVQRFFVPHSHWEAAVSLPLRVPLQNCPHLGLSASGGIGTSLLPSTPQGAAPWPAFTSQHRTEAGGQP